MKTYKELLQKTYSEQLAWSSSRFENPLLASLDACDDSIMTDMPGAFQALFNNKSETQIGDSVISFLDGSFYLKSINGIDVKDMKIIGSVNCSNTDRMVDESRETQTRSVNVFDGDWVSYGTLGPNMQKEFRIEGKKYKFKYVHEIKAIDFRIPTGWVHHLLFVLKLEYRGSGRWKRAGEYRNVKVNLSGTHNLNIELNDVQYDKSFLLAERVDKDGLPSALAKFYVKLQGDIIQSISRPIELAGYQWHNRWPISPIVDDFIP